MTREEENDILYLQQTITKGDSTMNIEGITCDKCNKLFLKDSEDYFTIEGNIYIGERGGLIGNNCDEEGKVVRINHFCEDCLKKILFEETKHIRECIKEHTPSIGFIDEDFIRDIINKM
ncbi:MAG: hypothetical protein RBT49_04580 [Bacteroidales bacterium]|nr:hypothetical protein [Bacteroidales bacterium]